LKWCFGYELAPRAPLRSATDAERATAVLTLAAQGITRQVLACGVWTRSALEAHGGFGYGHLMTRVLPRLREAGLAEPALRRMLVDEPARLLDRGDL
jgi:phosphotriesterase-related protein